MAKSQILKILKLPVGSYQNDKDEERHEYREIGRLIEHTNDNGDSWHSIMLNADILNPVLFQMVRPTMKKESSTCMVRLYDLTKGARTKTDEEPPFETSDDGEGPY
jgi:hypothetical protein